MTHPFSRILLATDLSEPSRSLLGPAAMLAHLYGAQLKVVFADETDNVQAFAADGFSDLHSEIADAAVKSLEASLDELEALGVVAEGKIVEASPRDAISRVARDFSADLVIVGMATRTDNGILVGSTTRWLLRHLSVPVLAVPLEGGAPQSVAWNRVVATTDFSDDSRSGVRAAHAICGHLGAELNVVHVVKLPRLGTYGEVDVDKLPPEQKKRVEELMRGRIASVSEEVEHGVGHTVLSSPHVPEGIVRAANDWAADAVVVPSHGKGAIRATLLGSTSERLVELSTVPVFVLPKDWLESNFKQKDAG